MTILCPNCNRTTINKSLECSHCGSALESVTTEVQLVDINEDDMTLYPISVEDTTEDDFEENDVVDTRNIDVPEDEHHAGDNLGGALMQGGLLLFEPKTSMTFRIPVDDLDEVVLGRSNSRINYKPTVDLSVLQGQKFGVSRRHATLRRSKSLLLIVDHHSVNGTFLNGQRLVPEQDRIVRDKDFIRLGGLILQVIYVNAPSE